MARKWILRISLGLSAATMIGCACTYFFIKSAVVEMYGVQTETIRTENHQVQLSKVFITNVNVLSPTGDFFLEQHTVVIEDRKIFAIIKNSEIPESATIIDGENNYLVPGFTDSHVHLWRSKNDLSLYLANGVTQIREMHGIDTHIKWRSEIEKGRLGPDIYVTASQLATYSLFEGIWESITAERNVVRSERDLRRKVKSLKAKGYDSIKASSYLGPEAYDWASEAAQDYDIPLIGHIPLKNTLDDLWSTSQTEVSHVEEFVKVLNREFGNFQVADANDFLAFVEERKSELAQQLLDRQISVTSTLALIQSLASQQVNIDEALDKIELKYVNPGLAGGQAIGWLPNVNRYKVSEQYRTDGWEDRQSRYWSAYVEAQAILFAEFNRAGVPILAGTDANVPVMVPGFSLHDELEVMRNAGMSSPEVFATATSIPAKWMNWPTGQISEGYKANLVILRENPLEDISATKSIEMVFVNGHILDRNDLDTLLGKIENANEASREIN